MSVAIVLVRYISLILVISACESTLISSGRMFPSSSRMVSGPGTVTISGSLLRMKYLRSFFVAMMILLPSK